MTTDTQNTAPGLMPVQIKPELLPEVLEAVKARIKHHKTYLKLYGGIAKATKGDNAREKQILELEKFEKDLIKSL